MLRDVEKVTSSSDRLVPAEEEILFAVLGSSNLMVRNRKVRRAERASNLSGYPIDLTPR